MVLQDMVHTQQLYFWQHYRANRLKGNPANAGDAAATWVTSEVET